MFQFLWFNFYIIAVKNEMLMDLVQMQRKGVEVQAACKTNSLTEHSKA